MGMMRLPRLARCVGMAAVLALAVAAGCSDPPAPAGPAQVGLELPDSSGRELVDISRLEGSSRQVAEQLAAQAGMKLVNPEVLPDDNVYSGPQQLIPVRAALASVAASARTGVAVDAEGEVRFTGVTTLEAWRDPEDRQYFAVHADNVDAGEVLRLAAARAGTALVHDEVVAGVRRDVVLHFTWIPAPTLYRILAHELGVEAALYGDSLIVGSPPWNRDGEAGGGDGAAD